LPHVPALGRMSGNDALAFARPTRELRSPHAGLPFQCLRNLGRAALYISDVLGLIG
jgi:hypothetical protein